MSVVLTNQKFRFKVTRTVRGTVDVDAPTEDDAREKLYAHVFNEASGVTNGDITEVGDWEDQLNTEYEREDA